MEILLGDGMQVPIWEGQKCEEQESFPKAGGWPFYVENGERIMEVWDMGIIVGRGSKMGWDPIFLLN